MTPGEAAATCASVLRVTEYTSFFFHDNRHARRSFGACEGTRRQPAPSSCMTLDLILRACFKIVCMTSVRD